MAVLRSVVGRMAAIIRACGASYVVVQVAIWHGYYAAHPWLLAGPLVAVAWGCAAAAYLSRRRPPWPLIILDTSFYAALAIMAGMCVPPEMRGLAGNWLYVSMVSQVIVTVWFAPRPLVVLGLAPEAAYWAGTAATPPGPAQGNAPAVSGALLLVVLAVHWTGRGVLYRRAARADLGFAAADQEAHDQYVVLSRNIERREHERLLHDTVLNTLTAISRGGAGPAVVARCRQDIALLEHALTAPGDPAAPPAPGGDSLVADVRSVAREMRARGMTVHVAVAGGEPGASGPDASGPGACGPGACGPHAGDPGPGGPVPGGAGLPVPVASALVHATREALANVAAHAGTGEAWVTITRGAGPGVGSPGAGGPGGPDTVCVTVRDAGAGFDPARVDPARLGLRRSITERVADWGGRVSVRSAPGQGTVVSMSWPGTVPAAEADLVGVDSSW
jgi:signal transduction histidine kinase